MPVLAFLGSMEHLRYGIVSLMRYMIDERLNDPLVMLTP